MYKQYNPNPKLSHAGDCVVRAICKAENKDWDTVYTALCVQGFVDKEWGNNNAVWDRYLRQHGYKRHTIPDLCPDCYTTAQFAADNPQGIYILATGTHVVCVADGAIYDSWDSSMTVPIYYYVKE